MKKLNKEEISILREKFLISYSKKMGWCHKELTTSQIMIIISKDEYISPSL
jgi:hypothetical protein